MRSVHRPAILLAVFLGVLAIGRVAGGADLEGLCRAHGIGDPGDVRAIGTAYDGAVAAGIREEELLPFVEDILRHKLSCGQMVRVLDAAARLSRENLPYFVVFSKVREGVAKGAPPALVVQTAEGKLRALSASKDVLKALASSGYRAVDFRNAAVVVSSYIEKGYAPEDLVTGIRSKGVEGSGFTALVGMLEKRSSGTVK